MEDASEIIKSWIHLFCDTWVASRFSNAHSGSGSPIVMLSGFWEIKSYSGSSTFICSRNPQKYVCYLDLVDFMHFREILQKFKMLWKINATFTELLARKFFEVQNLEILYWRQEACLFGVRIVQGYASWPDKGKSFQKWQVHFLHRVIGLGEKL